MKVETIAGKMYNLIVDSGLYIFTAMFFNYLPHEARKKAFLS